MCVCNDNYPPGRNVCMNLTLAKRSAFVYEWNGIDNSTLMSGYYSKVHL